jgi:hypothetical protein
MSNDIVKEQIKFRRQRCGIGQPYCGSRGRRISDGAIDDESSLTQDDLTGLENPVPWGNSSLATLLPENDPQRPTREWRARIEDAIRKSEPLSSADDLRQNAGRIYFEYFVDRFFYP